MQTILNIAQQFCQAPSLNLRASPLGNGLINDTYLITGAECPWVLQKINRQVFPEPQHVMQNLVVLSRHAAQKTSAATTLAIPSLRLTHKQETSFVDTAGDYWRGLAFIPNSFSKEALEGFADARKIGQALGQFHVLCDDLASDLLLDTLPGFHIAPDYLAAYEHASAQAKPEDSADYRFCRDFIQAQRDKIGVLETAKASGLLRMRVMHGDPKVNNFLFDQDSQEIVSLIDLDTVKPGLWHYDIGDCLRSCCHDVQDDCFNLAIAEALLGAYLQEMAGIFSREDYAYVYAAIELIPFELGLRFFTDYLQGNRYFKVSTPDENLTRAVQQFKLTASIIEQQAEIELLLKRWY